MALRVIYFEFIHLKIEKIIILDKKYISSQKKKILWMFLVSEAKFKRYFINQCLLIWLPMKKREWTSKKETK